jgi:hypothetical protein
LALFATCNLPNSILVHLVLSPNLTFFYRSLFMTSPIRFAFLAFILAPVTSPVQFLFPKAHIKDDSPQSITAPRKRISAGSSGMALGDVHCRNRKFARYHQISRNPLIASQIKRNP